jgi:hypothetical protein
MFPPTMSTEQNPYEAPKTVDADGEPTEEANPYWGRTSILDWYSCLGVRGKLRWIGGIFLAVNAISYLFGFLLPKLLIAGIAAILARLALPGFIDD